MQTCCCRCARQQGSPSSQSFQVLKGVYSTLNTAHVAFAQAGSTLSWANPQDKLDPSELVKGKQVEVPAYSLRAVGVNGDMPTALMQQWGAKALTNGRGPKGKKP